MIYSFSSAYESKISHKIDIIWKFYD